jgi:hypothetical protein
MLIARDPGIRKRLSMPFVGDRFLWFSFSSNQERGAKPSQRKPPPSGTLFPVYLPLII